MSGKTKRTGGGDIKMSDIARHAGVSPMTVSRALREPSTVSEKMRRKVDAAVREFGYLPNRIAGSLSSKRSNVVGLIVPSIRNSLYANMIQAISGCPARQRLSSDDRRQ
jgi:LacI family gluconate utilization system Gnt-I transcriptional repressor